MDSIKTLIERASFQPFDPNTNFWIGEEYLKIDQTASAVSFYLRAAEYGYETHPNIVYTSLLRIALCFDKQQGRGHSSVTSILQAISYMPNRPEGYFYLSRYNERMGNWQEAYTFADLGLRYAERTEPLPVNVEYPGKYALLFEKAVSGWWLGREKESHDIFKDLLKNYPIAPEYREGILNNLKNVKDFSEQEDLVNTMEPIVSNYRKYFGKKASTIIDIGTRDGDDANWLKERLHATKVIAIDASPSAFELTKERYPWMEVHHVAISDYEGETIFQQVISDDISEVGCSSIYADKVVNNERFKGKVNKINVPVTRMDSLLRENTTGLLDLVKVDVEGFTWEVLKGFGLRLRDVKMFHLETDHIKTQPNHKSPKEIAAFMEANDFFLVDTSYEWGPGIEDQIWINKDYVIYHKEVFN